MTRGWFGGGLLTAILAGLVGAGIVHITTTFATPELMRPNAYDRLVEHLPVNSLVVLPPPSPETQLVPYQEPDMHVAFCHYDISSGPVTAQVILPSSGWTLALYSPAGDNFYVMPGRDQRITTVNAVLVSAGDEATLPPPVTQRTRGAAPTYIHVPAPTGLLVIRGPLRGESYRAEVDAILARASCQRTAARQPQAE